MNKPLSSAAFWALSAALFVLLSLSFTEPALSLSSGSSSHLETLQRFMAASRLNSVLLQKNRELLTLHDKQRMALEEQSQSSASTGEGEGKAKAKAKAQVKIHGRGEGEGEGEGQDEKDGDSEIDGDDDPEFGAPDSVRDADLEKALAFMLANGLGHMTAKDRKSKESSFTVKYTVRASLMEAVSRAALFHVRLIVHKSKSKSKSDSLCFDVMLTESPEGDLKIHSKVQAKTCKDLDVETAEKADVVDPIDEGDEEPTTDQFQINDREGIGSDSKEDDEIKTNKVLAPTLLEQQEQVELRTTVDPNYNTPFIDWQNGDPNPPNTYDVRADPRYRECLFPISDQGMCGNCYAHAFSLATSMRWCLKEPRLRVRVSIEHIHHQYGRQHGNNKLCSGARLKHMAQGEHLYGYRSAAHYPLATYLFGRQTKSPKFPKYNRPKLAVGEARTDDEWRNEFIQRKARNAAKFLGKYTAVNRMVQSEQAAMNLFIDAVKKEVYKNGPIVFAIYGAGQSRRVRDRLQAAWNAKTMTERRNERMTNPWLTGGHAVTVVGWKHNPFRFVIANSWGTLWGDNGYADWNPHTYKLTGNGLTARERDEWEIYLSSEVYVPKPVIWGNIDLAPFAKMYDQSNVQWHVYEIDQVDVDRGAGTVQVKWNAPRNHHPKDYIAIFDQNAQFNDQPLAKKYIKKPGTMTGEVTLNVGRNTLQAGSYQLRFHLRNSSEYVRKQRLDVP